MFELLALLIFGHAMADFPLQTEFIARGKNRNTPQFGIPFWHPLTAHAVIHGGFVGIITGTVWLGIAETLVHWITDDAKCRGWIGNNTDQAIHIACKFVWVGCLMMMN